VKGRADSEKKGVGERGKPVRSKIFASSKRISKERKDVPPVQKGEVKATKERDRPS